MTWASIASGTKCDLPRVEHRQADADHRRERVDAARSVAAGEPREAGDLASEQERGEEARPPRALQDLVGGGQRAIKFAPRCGEHRQHVVASRHEGRPGELAGLVPLVRVPCRKDPVAGSILQLTHRPGEKREVGLDPSRDDLLVFSDEALPRRLRLVGPSQHIADVRVRRGTPS